MPRGSDSDTLGNQCPKSSGCQASAHRLLGVRQVGVLLNAAPVMCLTKTPPMQRGALRLA